MNKPETDLEGLLQHADAQLARSVCGTDGSSVRQRAEIRQVRRRVRNVAIVLSSVGLVIAAILMLPTASSPKFVTTRPPDSSTEISVLKADLAMMKQQRVLLEGQTELATLRQRLAKIDSRLQHLQRFPDSPEHVEKRNAAAFSILLAVTHPSKDNRTDQQRPQLEKLIEQFPNTNAAAHASRMLMQD